MAEAQAAAVDQKAAPVVPVAEPEKKPEGEGAAVEKPAPRSYTQEDLDRITAKVKKNERYRTRKEVEAFYQGRESIAPVKPAPAKPVEDAEPTRDKFATYEEFLEAKAAHIGRKVAREERANWDKEQKETQAKDARQKVINSFQSKLKAKFPDIEDRLEAIGDIVLQQEVHEAITESDLGPEVLDYLSRNPKDCERIASLAPSAALREIGKLEARIESAKPAAETAEGEPKPEPKETKKPSAAPAPIKPGGGSGSASDSEPRDSDKIDEWIRKDRALARKRAGR